MREKGTLCPFGVFKVLSYFSRQNWTFKVVWSVERDKRLAPINSRNAYKTRENQKRPEIGLITGIGLKVDQT